MSETPSFLHVLAGASGTGPGEVLYQIDNNTTIEPREGSFRIAGLTVPVTQPAVDACGFAVTPASATVAASQDLEQTLQVVASASTCAWTAVSQSPFIAVVDGWSGAGDGVVRYRVENNTQPVSRTGTIRVAGRTIPITQAAVGDCTYTLDPLEPAIPSGNVTDAQVSVTTGAACTWAAESQSVFLTVLGSRERTGAGVVTFTAQNNPANAPRDGRLLVAGTLVPVRQDGLGCTYDVPASVEVPGAGGRHDVLLATEAGCPITATDPDLTDFIDVLEPDQAAQTVPLQVLPNRSSLARTGSVVVSGQTVTVLQFPETFDPSQDQVDYYHTDAIGSVRMITRADGTVTRFDYLPFGEQWQPVAGERDSRMFAGKERDDETGLDYFGGRYYRSQTGRFTTVDPVLDLDQALVDPQRWNRYGYVRNSPFRLVDPDGRAIETLWDVVSLGMSLQALRQDPTSIWNWVSLGADVVSVVGPGIPAIGMAIREVGKVEDAVAVTRSGLRAGSGPAEGVLEISRAFKSSKAVQNYTGQGAEFVFDAASGRFVMGNMKHSDLAKKAGIEAGNTTVGGIIRRKGNQLITDEQSGTYWRNWTPEIRKKFKEFLIEYGISLEHFN